MEKIIYINVNKLNCHNHCSFIECYYLFIGYTAYYNTCLFLLLGLSQLIYFFAWRENSKDCLPAAYNMCYYYYYFCFRLSFVSKLFCSKTQWLQISTISSFDDIFHHNQIIPMFSYLSPSSLHFYQTHNIQASCFTFRL